MNDETAPSHPRIEDYAFVGDCTTGALIGKDGGVDWLCWPRFDSAACFAAILGGAEHGRWRLAPAAPARVVRSYDPGTLVLRTRFDTEDGAAEVIDFMPLGGEGTHLVRIVRGLRGRVAMESELVLRFEYGASVPWVERLSDGTIRAICGPEMVLLRSPVTHRGADRTTVATFTVAAGETMPLVLTHASSHAALPAPIDAAAALDATITAWRTWSDRCLDAGPLSDVVKHSLLVLKGLTYAPTGGIVAALTTSLPEQAGGTRNWDYRYCWLRDATFTLIALGGAGYAEEAKAWRDWLLRAVAGSPEQIQIMYGIGGERRLTEWEADWLPGFGGASPVRIGNAAANQLQLDVIGEMADAMFQARMQGMPGNARSQAIGLALLDYLERHWREPDEGIWEVRGPRQHFTHSKVMAWVAFDRAVKSVERLGIAGPAERWASVRDEIHADVCAKAFDPELGAFMQAYGSKALDASVLLIPLVGFLPIDDPRMQGTLRAIEQRLMSDGLVFRYDTGWTEDGLPPGEGAFIACSFWYIDNLILAGRRVEAWEMFERILALRNDVGLLAEEYDPASGRQMGNVPQAFSHVALVNTALNLTRPPRG
ncbi:MAG: glycoside hydrolase family 15 protein [Rhodospirillales bacterium]|nr:glycoside hydrolase family 15 protein [Rhodospirillales bacterium]